MASRFISWLGQPWLICLLLCLPLLWINVGGSHDWGGDFAQYLQQAQNLVNGESPGQSGYVYNPAYPMLGPPAYPMGYPVVLAPVLAIFGNDMLALIRYQSLLLIAFALLLQVFFRRRYSDLTAILLVLLVVYNPWTLGFKRELMSEIPFGIWLMLALILYENKRAAWAGMAAFMAILTRTLGWAWVPALIPLLAYGIWEYRKGREGKMAWRRPLLALLPALLLPLMVSFWIFQLPSGLSLYQGNMSLSGLWATVLHNLAYYVDVLQWFFQVPAGDLRFMPLITKACMLALIFIGAVHRWARRPELIDYLLLVYLGVLLLYPYRASGFRFLFPLLPILLVYAVEGFGQIRWPIRLARPWRQLLLAAIIILPYTKGISDVIKRQDRIVAGPQSDKAQAVFRVVQKEVPQDAVIAFAKPRVLAYYTERKATAVSRELPKEAASDWLRETGVGFVLIHPNIKDPVLHALSETEAGFWEMLWEGGGFRLYRIK